MAMVIVIDKGRTNVGGGITKLMNDPNGKGTLTLDDLLNLS